VRALAILAEHCPEYHAALVGVTRRIVVFEAADVNSFASINAHGAVFFNAGAEDDEVYFIDELVHQCGHVIFNAMTVRRRDFLAAAPSDPVYATAIADGDRRTVYDALHGLYTEHVMSSCMRTIEETGALSGRQAHELFGRLSFITRKHIVDLRHFGTGEALTELGQRMHRHFFDAYSKLVADRPELLATDMRGQPYNFDYRLFARKNPRSERRSRRPHRSVRVNRL
jgi:HEXXH motif-containing protein